MDEHDLTTMEFMKGDIPTLIPKYQVASSCLFIEYCKYMTRVGNHIDDFQLLTQEDLNEFNLMAPVTVTSTIPKFSTYPPKISDPAMKEFDSRIKRDPNHFHIFTNERNWLDYKDHTIVTANSQHVEVVLDPIFVRGNGDAIELLRLNKYMYFKYVLPI